MRDFLVSSFVELVKFIFDIPGVEAFLSEKLCQDSLEGFFSMQRQRGRIHENPNVDEFLNKQHSELLDLSVKAP